MGRRGIVRASAWAALLLWHGAGCSKGGAGSGGGGAGDRDASSSVVLRVIANDPADGAVQVARDGALLVQFDGVLVGPSLDDRDTRLRPAAGGSDIPLTRTLLPGGDAVRFVPATPLAAETDYVLQLSAFTCDVDARLLEEEFTLRFRTADTTPPALSASNVVDGSTGVARDTTLRLEFSADADAASLALGSWSLRDVHDNDFAIDVVFEGASVLVDPLVDLPGSRGWVLTATGIEDRSGNAADPIELRFTTAPDAVPPAVVATWPSAAVDDLASPHVRPTLWFDESIDPLSVESAAVRFIDEFAETIDYDVEISRDGRRLELVPGRPLLTGRSYWVQVFGGPGAPTDLSGNPLPTSHVLPFVVGSDQTPPTLQRTAPRDGSADIATSERIVLAWDEPVAVDAADVTLRSPQGPVAVDVDVSAEHVTVTPRETLRASTLYTLVVARVLDLAGNRGASAATTFATATPGTSSRLRIVPNDGVGSVPTGAHVSVVADARLVAATVRDGSVELLDRDGYAVDGELAVDQGNRVIRFAPASPLTIGAEYTFVVRGGTGGVRAIGAPGFAEVTTSTFRVGGSYDSRPPVVSVTLNSIDALRNGDLAVPPHGFSIDVSARDPDYSLDMSSTRVLLSGSNGPAPGSDTIFATARVGDETLRWVVPADQALPLGVYTLTAEVEDTSGNVGRAAPITFRVVAPEPGYLPFERTQIVWVRTDLDRDGDGRGDFLDDLIALGLCTEDDRAGLNARMQRVVLDGILARTHALFARKANGGRAASGSVSLRLSDRAPAGLRCTEIALGGADPEGTRGRGYGDASTGTLGRAYYDYRNGSVDDRATATRPGLGVFPREMFLFEADVHRRVYPSFLTSFARRFLALVPEMGGVPVGADPLDPRVLSRGFDFDRASSREQARYLAIFTAADDWATVIGTILAHEIGHTVGLVAPGRSSSGLHGDDSLHNEFSAVSDVMAASVGYESLLSVDYAFRDLSIAYMRHEVVLR